MSKKIHVGLHDDAVWIESKGKRVHVDDLTVGDLSFMRGSFLGESFLKWAEVTHPAYLNNLKAGFIRCLQKQVQSRGDEE